MSECGLCNGQGQIKIMSYQLLQTQGQTMKIAKGLWCDCPKCNGTGSEIE